MAEKLIFILFKNNLLLLNHHSPIQKNQKKIDLQHIQKQELEHRLDTKI